MVYAAGEAISMTTGVASKEACAQLCRDEAECIYLERVQTKNKHMRARVHIIVCRRVSHYANVTNYDQNRFRFFVLYYAR